MTNVIWGTQVAKQYREKMRQTIYEWEKNGQRIPCLSVILVGDHPASLKYVGGKQKACQDIGMKSRLYHLPKTTSQDELITLIHQLNQDEDVDGILVQLPLPDGLNEMMVLNEIDPQKDVDGLHPINVGRLFLNQDGLVPCTPKGIMALLKETGVDLCGKHAVVIGRSKLVGTPVSKLLENAQATVTKCHSKTKDLKAICRQADILVVAIGKAKMIDHEYIKKGAIVIDVGINVMADGKLCGDVDFDDVQADCSFITPVPKGVGPMTICMLLENTLKAYQTRRNYGTPLSIE